MKNTPKYVQLMKYMHVLENTYKMSFDIDNDDTVWQVTFRDNITKDRRSLMVMLYDTARRGYVVRESSTAWRLTPAGLDLLNHGISAKQPINLVSAIKAAKAENEELKQKLHNAFEDIASLVERNNNQAETIIALQDEVSSLTKKLNDILSNDECYSMADYANKLAGIAAKMANFVVQ